MTLAEDLLNVWKESMVNESREVEIEGRSYRVERTRHQGLRIVSFVYQDHPIEGIEQNPNTSSRWAKRAQQGERIMQFSTRGRYFANVCEGKLTRYPAWKLEGLPE